jgi:hypothetical protein
VRSVVFTICNDADACLVNSRPITNNGANAALVAYGDKLAFIVSTKSFNE